MTTFFTSDHHFGHTNIIQYSGRPFQSIGDMDDELIRIWNEKISPMDTVFYIGDFSLKKPTTIKTYLNRLHGQKFLIVGNHDRSHSSLSWEWTAPYHETRINGNRVVLSHYPFDVWNGAHRGVWHLHGHCHGSLTTVRSNRLDVGVDNHWSGKARFSPWSAEEITRYMETAPTHDPVDHHVPRQKSNQSDQSNRLDSK